MLKKLENLLNNEIDPAFAQRAGIIFSSIENEKPIRILDVGCGRGFYIHALSLYDFPKEIYGIDINEKYLQIAQQEITDKRVKIAKGDIFNLNFPDNFFDFIICSEILEHLPSDTLALKNLHKVLKKNGTLLVSVPNENFPFFWDPLNWILMHIFNTHIHKDIWWLAGIWADHVRLYSQKELEQKCIEANFEIDKKIGTIFACWPFTHFILYGIGKNIIERLNVTTFSRFNFNKQVSFLALFFKIPEKLFSRYIKSKDSSVGLVYILKKK